MKTFKIIALGLVSILLILYLSFLFILPRAIKLDKYSPMISKEIQKASGFIVETQGINFITSWNLSCGAKINKTILRYPNKEKFGEAKNLQMKISLPYLLIGRLKLDKIQVDNIILMLKVEKDGKFLVEKFIPKPQKNSTHDTQAFPIKLSDNMPDIIAKKYKITFVDATTNKEYSIDGSDFAITSFILNKKIKAKAMGGFVLDGRKQFTYDLALYSKVFPSMDAQTQQAEPQAVNIINIFKNLHKYNYTANLKTDLKITGTEEEPQIEGLVMLDKSSMTFNGKKLPDSSLKLNFNGDKVKINSDFYTDKNKKITLLGIFNNGKKKSINLNVESEKTDINTSFNIISSLLDIFNIDTLKGISADGELNAKFNIKSDFKTIKSEGHAKILNANVNYAKYNVALKDINSDIDFSNNKITIKKADALINGQPISVKGSVDTNANADIFLTAQNIQLKGILAAAGQVQTLKENDIQSGIVSVNAKIKGKLDKAVPIADITLSNINLKNKPNKISIKLKEAKVNASSDGKKTKGKAEIKDLYIYPQGVNASVSIPNAKLSFNEKDLNIEKAFLYLNNSLINISGKITDYQTEKININILAKGNLNTSDLKAFVPKEMQSNISAKGAVPMIAKITGAKEPKIEAQIIANQGNYITPLDIASLQGKPSLLNASFDLKGNNIKINEVALYELQTNKAFSDNLSLNLSSSEKVLGLSGSVSKIDTKNPQIEGINISIPNQISASIPGFKESILSAKGNLSVSGSANNPKLSGNFNLPIISIPTLKTKLQNTNLQINTDTINLKCPQLTIANSTMGFDATLDSDISKGIIAKNVNFNAENIDLDTLGAAFSNLPQNTNGPGTDLGITIQSGKGKVAKFKTGDLQATNAFADFNLHKNTLKMYNLTANAYAGKVAGTITYDLIYGNIGIDMQGRGLGAKPTLTALSGMPQPITGSLDFDSDITMRGYSPEQLIQSMKGSTDFIISRGEMGQLGLLGHLLYAQNIISNNVFRTSINTIIKAVTIRDTGLYESIKGKMTFSGGWANLSYIKIAGPSMSMYINGRFNLLNGNADLKILGRLSGDVVKVLGPLGELSVDKVLSYIPAVGEITSSLINQFTTPPQAEDTSIIPSLTRETTSAPKEFKVIIQGPVDKQTSVKSFKWLANPQAQQAQSPQLLPQLNQVGAQVGQKIEQIGEQLNEQIGTQAGETVKGKIKDVTAPVGDILKSLPNLGF